MNWKDHASCSEARAARDVGGKYRVTRHGAQASSVGLEPTWVSVGNDPLAYSYRVEYRAPSDGNWHDIRYPRGVPGTLAEAKCLAEEDHERRLRMQAEDDAERVDHIDDAKRIEQTECNQ
jgi:hypothetical protein